VRRDLKSIGFVKQVLQPASSTLLNSLNEAKVAMAAIGTLAR
jgi:hypothetical protein